MSNVTLNKVENSIANKGYTIDRCIEKGISYQISKANKKFLFKKFLVDSQKKVQAYKALSYFKGNFKRLVISSLHASGKDWVITNWFEGRDFENRWNERGKIAGGRLISKSTITMVLELAADLKRVKIKQIPQDVLSHLTKSSLKVLSARPKLFGLLTMKEVKQFKKLVSVLKKMDNKKIYLSNGDFYFRNFIQISPKKTAVIDWDSARLTPYEVEYCIACQWMLMWNNPLWRIIFLRRAKKKLSLNKEIFRAVLLAVTLEQAIRWRKMNIGIIPLRYVKKYLNDAEYDKLWNEK